MFSYSNNFCQITNFLGISISNKRAATILTALQVFVGKQKCRAVVSKHLTIQSHNNCFKRLCTVLRF